MSASSGNLEAQPDERGLSVLAQVSNEMVRLYKEQFGRGPRRVRAHWCGADALAVVLEDTLAPAERNLVALGAHQTVRDTRLIFQYATLPEFCEPVERITGRKVRAFVSGIDAEVDGLSIESFVFYPVGEEAGQPSRIERAPRR
ncbi:Na-translocating system protein MpsC family protein [Conexibacter arvalis]|uniref:Uncharacterized protein YbcI n=1 Tax=Conexibacter arvalis TaxID=912552 RepID=A0A840I6T1_9ACTN|nr:Na-translocating system protein MpsC family protein [Conexibacter arvalis]MBB4660599.1 uncharacterized protein YbcI [Conexibacter arvalis]